LETVLALAAGVGLAASCGFRIFVPMLIAGVATRNGYMDPSDSFAWIGTDVALITLAVATGIELIAYYVPWLDNLLDLIASPLSVVAGILLAAAMLGDVPPLMQWVLAILAGGGAAATVQAGTVLTRLTSTASSGGAANFAVTTLETLASVLFAALSIVVPIISVVLLIAAVGGLYYAGRNVIRSLIDRWRPARSRQQEA
jgi:hypothetical protein